MGLIVERRSKPNRMTVLMRHTQEFSIGNYAAWSRGITFDSVAERISDNKVICDTPGRKPLLVPRSQPRLQERGHLPNALQAATFSGVPS